MVAVERLVLQDCSGTAPWEHRPLGQIVVGEVVARLGAPDGISAFDPSSVPQRGPHAVGVKRQWGGHRGKVDPCQGGGDMGDVSRRDQALLDCRVFLPQEWAQKEQRRQKGPVPLEGQSHTRQEQGLAMRGLWGTQVPHGWVTGDAEFGRHTRFRGELRARGARDVLGVPCPPTRRALEAPRCLRLRGADGGHRPHSNR